MHTRAVAWSLVWGSLLLAGCTRDKPQDTSGQTPPTTQGPGMSNEKAAQSAAEAWLALVDAGNYPQSWSDAAGYFKKAIDQPGWQKALDATRTPLGKMLLRTLKSAKYATSLPGAPDGEYVVIQFDTSFERKQTAVETVTPMKEPDGTWRVSGYLIK
jgi:hypothetical protein